MNLITQVGFTLASKAIAHSGILEQALGLTEEQKNAMAGKFFNRLFTSVWYGRAIETTSDNQIANLFHQEIKNDPQRREFLVKTTREALVKMASSKKPNEMELYKIALEGLFGTQEWSGEPIRVAYHLVKYSGERKNKSIHICESTLQLAKSIGVLFQIIDLDSPKSIREQFFDDMSTMAKVGLGGAALTAYVLGSYVYANIAPVGEFINANTNDSLTRITESITSTVQNNKLLTAVLVTGALAGGAWFAHKKYTEYTEKQNTNILLKQNLVIPWYGLPATWQILASQLPSTVQTCAIVMNNTYVNEAMHKSLFNKKQITHGTQSLAYLWHFYFSAIANVNQALITRTAQNIKKFIVFLQEAISEFLTTHGFTNSSQQIVQTSATLSETLDDRSLHEFTPNAKCLIHFILPQVYFLKRDGFQKWMQDFTSQQPYQRDNFFMFI